jgi:hypothetical protein
MCDDSVHGISFDVDPIAHRQMADRADGAASLAP